MTGPDQIVIPRSVWSTSFAFIPGLVFLGPVLFEGSCSFLQPKYCRYGNSQMWSASLAF